MVDFEQTIISQYANSPTIVQLVKNFNQYIDPAADLDAFYSMVWDVDTATGFGLDIWGRIVGVSRELELPSAEGNFGFEEGEDYRPFGQASFYNGHLTSDIYALADSAYRVLILVKALGNISSCTAQSINQLLKNLFSDRGRCYVNDLGGMRMRFVFEFALHPYELAILSQSGAVPRPAAIDAKIFQLDIASTFGFKEAGCYQTFGNGIFFKG